MGLIGTAVGVSIIVCGGYVFLRATKTHKRALRIRQAPTESLLHIQDVVTKSQKKISGPVDSTDVNDYAGVYVILKGIVMTDKPIHCSIAPGKAVVRQIVDYRDVTEKDGFGSWQQHLELKNIGEREVTDFYLVHESDLDGRNIKVNVELKGTTEVDLTPYKKRTVKAGMNDETRQEHAIVQEERVLLTEQSLSVLGEIVSVGSPPQLTIKAPKDKDFPFIVTRKADWSVANDLDMDADRHKSFAFASLFFGAIFTFLETTNKTDIAGGVLSLIERLPSSS